MDMEPTDGAGLSPRARRASLAAIIASTFGVGVNLGVLTPLVALILERDGVDAILIGLNAAMPALAMLLWGGLIGSFYTPTLALLGQSFATGDLAVANAAFILVHPRLRPGRGRGTGARRRGPGSLGPPRAAARGRIGARRLPAVRRVAPQRRGTGMNGHNICLSFVTFTWSSRMLETGAGRAFPGRHR